MPVTTFDLSEFIRAWEEEIGKEKSHKRVTLYRDAYIITPDIKYGKL